MIQVEVARRRSVRSALARSQGRPHPHKDLWRARTYFAWACVVAVVAVGLLPAACVAGGYALKSEAAPGIRLAMFGGALWSLALLLMAIGVGITGQRMGILWTARNTYSLSKLQITLWTLVVMAGLATVVACRVHGLFVAASPAGFASALDIYIPSELLAVMGISIGSAAAVPAILSVKARSDAVPKDQLAAATSRTGAPVEAIGRVAARSSDYPPLMQDLFQGDDVAKTGTVDIGKVQQAIVTLILLATYLGMLAELFMEGSWTVPAGLKVSTTPMPAMSQTFVYLLGISHAGYLAYKAAPAAPGTSGAMSASAMAPAPGSQLPRPAPPTLTAANRKFTRDDEGKPS